MNYLLFSVGIISTFLYVRYKKIIYNTFKNKFLVTLTKKPEKNLYDLTFFHEGTKYKILLKKKKKISIYEDILDKNRNSIFEKYQSYIDFEEQFDVVTDLEILKEINSIIKLK